MIVAAVLLFVVGLAASTLYGIYYGIKLNKLKIADSYDEFFENALQSRFSIISNFIKGSFASNPERIVINIKPKHFQTLAHHREVSLANGIMLTSEDDFVPAEIHYKNEIRYVRLRLKGDWVDHLMGDKWSFRIVVKGDSTLFGMKQFSIHHPRSRNFIYEWIYFQALKREGLIALRYDFIDVTLNGKDLGIYAVEEHFEKRLIEHNEFREGPIIKLNESFLWEDRAVEMANGGISLTNLQSENASNIDVFKTSTILGDPILYHQFRIAHNLLESFRYGKLPTHKVFDLDRLAKLYALSDLFGANHSIVWHNLRFYYNPVTSVLEPIGFDANPGRTTVQVVGAYRNFENPISKFKDLAFSDKLFYEAYLRALERFASESYLENLFKDIDADLQKNLKILHKEFPYFYFSKRPFYDNLKVIQSTLNPTRGLHVYAHEKTGHQLIMQLGNVQALPIEVLNLSYRESSFFRPVEPVILSSRLIDAPVAYQKVGFALPANFAWADSMANGLRVTYRILGTTPVRQEAAFLWPREDENFIENDFIRREPNIEKFPFLMVDESDKKILIKPGKWTIDQSLIIPPGFVIVGRAGTQLNLTNSALILSYSPVDFQGSEDYPIRVQSPDSTGQGLIVISAKQPSLLNYVIFDHLSNPSQHGWSVTSAVTFYESPAHFSYCQFSNNHCEDALNMIRSEYTIDNSLFKHTHSDAFDSDFSDGKVTNTSFVSCGNDAIDISGSHAEVSNVFIDGTGDKGLSAGENSTMTASDIEIKNAAIVFAGKDMSEVNLKNITAKDSELGFTLYQKKPEYDAAFVTVTNLKMINVKVPFLVEERSRLTVDGKEIPPARDHVKEILYGVMYGKASKPTNSR
jgi:hypothetical protein